MDKIWFILINEKQEGPFSFDDLKNDNRINPDTWIWRQGFENWEKIRNVQELKELFRDPSLSNALDDTEFNELKIEPIQDELVIDMGQVEPPFYVWLLLALIAILYVLVKLYL